MHINNEEIHKRFKWLGQQMLDADFKYFDGYGYLDSFTRDGKKIANWTTDANLMDKMHLSNKILREMRKQGLIKGEMP